MFNILKKAIVEGYNLIFQEKLITFINIGTIILVSLFIWLGIFSFYFFNQMIGYLQERLDFSIYFKPEVQREEILKIKKILENFPGVSSVEFVPQEEAFQRFQQEAKSNPVISRALKELQTNPLVDYLIVKADSSEIYPKIADYLEKSPYKNYIDYVTYFENQKAIKKTISLSQRTKILITFVIALILFFSSLIIFNTTLVSIYSQKEEIEILRIIGASNWFIRLPFFVYIFLFSVFGYIISLGIIILLLIKTENFWPTILPNFQPSIFVLEKFFLLNISIFCFIFFVNIFIAILALEKYLKK